MFFTKEFPINRLGAMIRSMSTGIILNSEMDDFSTPGTVNEYGVPASPANFIVPKKRPVSSMVPTIIVDKYGEPSLLIGAAGGTKITTSVVYVILQNLFLNKPIFNAISAKRIHHQLAPMVVQHEQEFDYNILKDLNSLHHALEPMTLEPGFSAVTAISKDKHGKISASYDPRRGGSIAILN